MMGFGAIGRCFTSPLFRSQGLGLVARNNNNRLMLLSQDLSTTAMTTIRRPFFRYNASPFSFPMVSTSTTALGGSPPPPPPQCRSFAHTAKSHSGMKKRFRVRANGSIKRAQAGKQHNTGYKARSRKNRLGQPAGIKDKTIERKLKLRLGARGM